MIRVHTADEKVHDFPGGLRYCTDEHNNLEVMAGRGDTPEGCFAAGYWVRIEVISE